MSDSLINFVRNGRIGELQVGMSRDEVRAKLGLPEDWLGKPVVVPEDWSGDIMDKPMNIGPPIHSLEDADGWLYYNGAVGIYFESSGISKHISMAMPTMEKDASLVIRGSYPLEDWPLTDHPTMGEMRKCLLSDHLRLEEPNDDEHDHFLAESLCLIECWPFHKGERLKIDDRGISIIWRFRASEDIPDYITR